MIIYPIAGEPLHYSVMKNNGEVDELTPKE